MILPIIFSFLMLLGTYLKHITSRKNHYFSHFQHIKPHSFFYLKQHFLQVIVTFSNT